MKKKEHFPYLSATIVEFLRDQEKLKLHEIGKLAGGLSESFVSRVANKKSNFTCKHLEDIERNFGRSIAFMLLNAIPEESVPEQERELYRKYIQLLQKLNNLQGAEKLKKERSQKR